MLYYSALGPLVENYKLIILDAGYTCLWYLILNAKHKYVNCTGPRY